jgi:hypothetical protein
MNDPLKNFRKRFRKWHNTRRLAEEAARYHRAFVARSLRVPAEQEIGALLRARLPQVRSKPKGALRILAIFHHYNWECDALLPPLRRFGAVRHYDWAPEFDHKAKGWHRGPKRRMNEALLGRVRRWIDEEGVDVAFCYLSGENVYPETVDELVALGVPMVNLALNDKESFVGRIRNGQAMGARDICRYFHLCWTSTADALEKYCVEGAVPLYLPEGADPLVHRPYEVDRTIDVSFVGQCYGNRPEIIERLRRAGIDVEAYGFGWPNGPLTTEEMVRMYSRSRINIGFGGVDGLEAIYCLKGRDFEIPMSGGLYLTEYHPELERCFRLGEEIVTYRDFDELLEMIRVLLADPEKAEMIRLAGYRRALAEHTWEMRFDKVFRLLGVLA